jgi:BirA family biotin operon repressor/biotin-[acetyl-CoA-carboxylase] ligase
LEGDRAAPPRILRVRETGSTNADAMRLALEGEDLPLWIMADTQTAGRGRAGRSWISPAGNLYASLAICCTAPLENAGQLSLIAGISLYDAIRTAAELTSNAGLRLKWPNDILVGLAKIGGILIESTSARGRPGFLAILGFGLNIATSPEDIGRPATSLNRHGSAPPPDGLLRALAGQVSYWLEQWYDGANFAAIRTAWMDRAGPIGEEITVTTAAGPVRGTYQGLSESGGLLAEVEGVLREISHGDVALGGQSANDGGA